MQSLSFKIQRCFTISLHSQLKHCLFSLGENIDLKSSTVQLVLLLFLLPSLIYILVKCCNNTTSFQGSPVQAMIWHKHRWYSQTHMRSKKGISSDRENNPTFGNLTCPEKSDYYRTDNELTCQANLDILLNDVSLLDKVGSVSLSYSISDRQYK